jgi:integrase
MVKIGGKPTKLVKGKTNREEAERLLHELLSKTARQPDRLDARVADIVEAFLRHSRIHYAPDTSRIHRYYCQLFAEACGQVQARELRPYHISRWVDKKREAEEWGESTVFNAKRIAFRVCNWAVEEGLLTDNPLKGMKRPKPSPRQRAMTEEEFELLYQHAGGPFRDFLLALHGTGARPIELRQLKWTQVHEDRLILEKGKTSKKTGKARIIFLTPQVREMFQRLDHSSPYVFLNVRGKPWTMNAVRLQVARLKKALRLPSDICAYLCRHGFGTRAIMNGVNPAVVAELMGHSSLEMVSKVYVHLADQHQHLRDALEQITPATPSPVDQGSVPKRARLKPRGGGGERGSSSAPPMPEGPSPQ